ncbi:conjugal transfer protein TraH [Sphingobium baderi]|uniref:Tyr recombinase domain-containing protein n=1 Tax=Sphingobium baderi LL03 TaxID=1114964 RepID=T0I2U6_9SPHN|nr:conjugal transfer protein TraH [Sphingobium baderi]EQB03964.1 hypothetical protein L485_05385 [Sphingobium baderi LL03]KMS63087.1 hypothetical protein V475_04460 [Sphingobium baderi LL03]
MASFRRLTLRVLPLLAACGFATPASAQSWAESWFDNVTYTSPGSFEDQTRGYITAGGMSGRVDVHNDYLMSVTLPKIRAGCGGIDMFLGGMSFLDPDYLVQKLESILQAAPAVAFQYLLETLDEKMGNIISKMEAATNFLNSIQVNDCRLANRMVQIAKGDDNMSGIMEEMTGYKSVREGFSKSYQQSREKIQANQGNPTEDLKDALENCPAEVTEIFRTGSLLAHAAARVGASEWAGVMRARVPLRGIFELAVDDELLERSPLDRIKSQKHQKREPDPFDREETEQILAYMRDHYDEQVWNWYEFAFGTGMRPSEQIVVQWRDVDWKRQTIRIERARVRAVEKSTKTRTVRDIDLTPRMMAVLQRQKAHSFMRGLDSPIFINPVTNTPWPDVQDQRKLYFHPTLRALGIRSRDAYQTRHTYATTALMGGVNPAYISRQLGHRSAAMLFRHYSKWIDHGDFGREAAKLNQIYGDAGPSKAAF